MLKTSIMRLIRRKIKSRKGNQLIVIQWNLSIVDRHHWDLPKCLDYRGVLISVEDLYTKAAFWDYEMS